MFVDVEKMLPDEIVNVNMKCHKNVIIKMS